jgi:hypothetical protein
VFVSFFFLVGVWNISKIKIKPVTQIEKYIFKLKEDKHYFTYNILKTSGIINVYTK